MQLSFKLFIILGGYFIGSISPSYILGRILKKIDIRDFGTKNAGTMNTYKVLGLGPALITAVFDLSKGLLVMYFASLLGTSPLIMHLAGFATVIGHVFPFYLHFKGGQGVATATAMLLYYLIIFYTREWLPWESLFPLVFCVASFAFIAKKSEIIGSVALPVLAIIILAFSPFSSYVFFILSVIFYILFINIINIRCFQLLTPVTHEAKSEINWRLYLRPLALLLIIHYFNTGKKETLILIGSVVLFFLALDLSRLFSKKINIFFFKNIKDFYKSKEYRKFSSITMFLFSSFLTILLFDKAVAIMAFSFLIFGDFFSKFFGLHFGRTRIFNKSLEGSLAHFNACLLSGYIFLQFITLPFPVYLTGALTASISEVLPLGIDDNFSVALLSASCMSIFGLF